MSPTPEAAEAGAARERLISAERRGLRLAILCRTVVVAVAAVWFVTMSYVAGYAPNLWGVAALAALVAVGVAHLAVIGSRFDRRWLKYAIYGLDILGVCLLFAILPLSRGAEVPQILAFRANGIYYLFPLVALACLSLSWQLVIWAGSIATAGWWAAFAAVVAEMPRRLSWGDIPAGAPRGVYEEVFLSIDFIGIGNRIEETGFLISAALIMAIAVYRARKVFFAQIAAEAERERITSILGRYVPEAIARRLVSDEAALAPQVRHGAVLILDVRDFTAFARARDPAEVIAALNGFLAACAGVVSAHDGVVVTFMGDGLLATFNTPLRNPTPEASALEAAAALRATARDSDFAVRIGIAAGPVAAGSVGSAERQAFTVYGDTVNRASRLEGLAKALGEGVLADQAVAAKAPGPGLRALGPHAIRGFAEPVPVWAA